jgi:hypothetical protein
MVVTKKVSFEIIMLLFNLRKIIPSKSRPSFEALLVGLENPFNAIRNT